MFVAHFIVGADGVHIHREIDLSIGKIRFGGGHRAGEGLEASLHFRDHQVGHSEFYPGMGIVERPFCLGRGHAGHAGYQHDNE